MDVDDVLYCVVQAPPSIVDGPPAGVIYFSDNLGTTKTLNCRATGKPEPESVVSVH